MEKLQEKRFEWQRETWKKTWTAQYEDSKHSSKKRKNTVKNKQARSKLTANFLCFTPQQIHDFYGSLTFSGLHSGVILGAICDSK